MPSESLQKNAKPSKPQQFLFVDDTLKHTVSPKQCGKRNAQDKRIRSQAAQASSNARVDTLLRRRADRAAPPGQQVFRVQPWPCIAVEKHQELVEKHQSREASIATHSHKILGGSIPAAQINIGVLSQFLNRFRTSGGPPSERPWVELVISSAGTSETSSSMVETAIQANATALFANDLRQPELYRHALKQHLWAISKLQSELESPRWHEPAVLYTCMILTLYDAIIPQGDPLARITHVRGVAQLFRQRGVHRFVHGMENRCFRYFRINILMVGLHDRQPCYLAEPDWKTIPFSGDCPPKSIVDLLIDILLELPGVLHAAEALRKEALPRRVLLQKAFELAFWVRRLIQDLEQWKALHIWTHATVFPTAQLRHLGLLELCELATSQEPYLSNLGEALNCWCAAHLMLARIAWALADQSFLLGIAVQAPYSLHDLVEAILLVSKRHIAAKTVDLVSMMVTGFPLNVAADSISELNDLPLFETIRGLLDQVNKSFARRFNITYSMSSDSIV